MIQRVTRAAVSADGEITGSIGPGLAVLVGVGQRSTVEDARWLAAKTEQLRVFPGEGGRMARSVVELGGGILAVSQFTLYGDTRKGRRPSFTAAAGPEQGEELYDAYCAALSVPVATGRFGAYMTVDLAADGPVTLLLRSEDGEREGP
nr:D-aminoacyl-tRNA deacylase [Egibacter rhizosphaerae]